MSLEEDEDIVHENSLSKTKKNLDFFFFWIYGTFSKDAWQLSEYFLILWKSIIDFLLVIKTTVVDIYGEIIHLGEVGNTFF